MAAVGAARCIEARVCRLSPLRCLVSSIVLIVAASTCRLAAAQAYVFWPYSGYYDEMQQMATASVAAAAAAVAAAAQTDDLQTVEKRFTQRLDHFNATDERNFTQRYFENWRHHRGRACGESGPIFLVVGGEAALQRSSISDARGLASILAAHFGGAMLALEHRYYGDSFPDAKNSSDFAFLSSRQAVEDLRYFIQRINEERQLTQNARWIILGCSYPGSLATWLRARYPEATLGAIAISAPLDVRMDFHNYKTAVSDALWRISVPCAARLRDAFQLLNAEIQSKDRWAKIGDELGIATNANASTDLYEIEAVHTALMSNFLFALGGHVQNRQIEHLRTELCQDVVLDMRRPLLKMLGAVGRIESVPEYGVTAWTRQLCSEFGWFVTSSSAANTSEEATKNAWPDLFAFNITVDKASEFCRYSLGEQFTPESINARVTATQEYYGRMENLNSSNIIFVEGSNDPWKPLQMQKQHLRAGNVLIDVKEATHCATSYVSNLPQIREAQSLIMRTIDEWLQRSPRSMCCGAFC